MNMESTLDSPHIPDPKALDMTPPSIFGLEDIGNGVKEWVTRIRKGQGPGKQPPETQEKRPYSSLVMGKSFQADDSTLPRLTRSYRYPWEGFFDVGFRCALSARSKN